MKGTARELAWPMGLLLACIAAYFALVLPPTLVERGPESLMASFDLQSYFRPRFWLGSDEIWRGRLPLWNPYEYGGIPLLATGQPATLYPPKVLVFGLFDPVTGIWVFLALHYLLASAGFLWFLHSEGFRGPSLFAGTALWIFGTPVLASNYHPVRLACLSWMPIVFLLSSRVASGGGLRPFALLACSVALQIFAGYPEFTIDLGLLVAVHATIMWLQGRTPMPPHRSVPLLAAAFTLGALAAAVQLLPLGELAGVARRVDVAAATATTLPEAMLNQDLPIAVIPGLAIFTFVGLFLRKARSPAVGYLLCVAIGGGAWQLLKYLPGFSMVRFPLAWVLLALFYFAWLGAAGLASLTDEKAFLTGRGRKVALAWLILCATFITLLWPLSAFAGLLSPGWLGSKLTSFFSNNIRSLWGLGLGTLGGGVLLVLAGRALRGKSSPGWLWFGTLLTLSAAHITAYPHGASPAPFAPPAPQGITTRLHGRPGAVSGRSLALSDLLYGYEITDRIPSALGVEISFIPWRCRQVLEHFEFVPTFGLIDWLKVLGARGFWNAMNVQFVTAHSSLTPMFTRHRLWPIRHDGGDMLFENGERMGQAWVNYAVRPFETEEDARRYVLGSRFNPAREVVLVEPTRGTYPRKTKDPVTPPLRVSRKTLTDVTFEVELPRPGVFVVSESAYPGWVATVNGAETPWLTANYLLRAVELPRGRHTVRFQYRPASVRYGLALSGLGLATIAALYVAGRRRAARARA